MPDWVFWLIFAAALAAGEVATLGFFLGAVALAALPAALVAAAGASLTVQLLVFIVGSIAWGVAFDSFRPDRWDLIGAAICLAGVATIMYAPR